MTTNYIDVAFHGSAFPATYTVPGSLRALGNTDTTNLIVGNVTADLEDDEITGHFTGQGNAVVIPVGFNPAWVRVINWTDGKTYEWMLGAPATDVTLETSTTDVAVDTNSLIVVTPADGTPGSNGSVTFAEALAVSAKVISFRIEG